MKTKMILASLVTAAAIASPAFANDTKDVTAKFTAADSNKDGSLSPAEWTTAGWPKDKWDAVDANKDGKVTLAEKEAAHAKMDKEDHHG